MPNSAPPARYDLPWKAVLKHAFRAFVDFYFPGLGARIDWRQQPRFHDKEFQGAGFGAAPNLMVADILAEVRMHHCGQRALIHVDIQAQRAADRLGKEHEMELLNQLEQMFVDNGIKKGLAQGLERGRRDGAAALLERQLEQRFGPLPQTARKKLAKASLQQVEAWSDALATAESLKQVLK